MHLLERLAVRFNEAGTALMALKGAALHLAYRDDPGDRPMSDLDVMVKISDLGSARTILDEMGCRPAVSHVREDFFPRFHYETEYQAGRTWPLKVDLHVRPLRPLRYSRLVPANAFWSRAEPAHLGRASVLIPCPSDMLVHLAAHAGFHGCSRRVWRSDIRRWVCDYGRRIDWDQVIDTVRSWHLAAAVQAAIAGVERDLGPVCPPDVRDRLFALRPGWRDRLALSQAPRDADHPVAHVLVNALSTPGWRFRLSYLVAALLPDAEHMGEWYGRRHPGWLATAHLLRLGSPLVRLVPRWRERLGKIEIREDPNQRAGVFATRAVDSGELIIRCRVRPADRAGPYVVQRHDESGRVSLHEIVGKTRFFRHSCCPNAKRIGFELRALQPVSPGQQITIDYRQVYAASQVSQPAEVKEGSSGAKVPAGCQ